MPGWVKIQLLGWVNLQLLLTTITQKVKQDNEVSQNKSNIEFIRKLSAANTRSQGRYYNERINTSSWITVSLSFPPETARKDYKNISFLYIGRLKKPFAAVKAEVVGPKIQDLYEGNNKFFTLYMDVLEVWLYNKKAFYIYKKLSLAAIM
jgi:hypothetical protein